MLNLFMIAKMLSLTDVALAAASYIAAHIIFVCIYRVFFHPYAKYPGPLLAKITTLYGAYHAYQGDMHLDVEKCHKKYGKLVRYGPNALLVNSPEGFHDIYGNAKKVKKAKSYKVHGDSNLIGVQDKTEYARFKKIFAQGFSDAAIREHEPKVLREVNTFVEKMSENEYPEINSDGWTNPKNMSQWCNYLTTDVVSKVVFTASWDLMTTTTNRSITEIFKAIVRLIGVLHYWPLWHHEITALICMPHLAWCMKALREFSLSVMARSKEEREKDPSIKNIFNFFSTVRDPDTGELALNFDDVRRNTGNFIIAGSDTTASSIAATFFYLSHNPEAYTKVAKEVRSAFQSADEIKAGPALNSCVYLRAAINEAMRMAPVAPQPLWREADPSGCLVDGILIPAGYNVGTGIFSLQHRAEAFPDPYTFNMERWVIDPSKDELEEKERIKQISRSFAPFSVGPRQCIAKNFALMELLFTMANVFLKLDFEHVGNLGEGKEGDGEGREREGEFQMKSYFTSYMEGPMIRFKVRKI